MSTDDLFNMAGYAIGRHARATPEKTALLVCDVENPRDALEAWTFAELDHAVRNLAAGLAAKGLRRGDRIGIRLGNSSQSALMFFAGMAGGFVSLSDRRLRVGAPARRPKALPARGAAG